MGAFEKDVKPLMEECRRLDKVIADKDIEIQRLREIVDHPAVRRLAVENVRIGVLLVLADDTRHVPS